ncbi:MAG: N-6 DNA methylase [Candidatus Lokiarchaeota archaeon]|nr:N-6 DNA methylase [Candidatus Lokiarchaeota archaeon]MBD3200576.1 N-6 DNA methylase [Candidatus Lokiarchaeota archaeon]
MRDTTSYLKEIIKTFEERDLDTKSSYLNSGTIYTPLPIIKYMVKSSFRLFLENNHFSLKEHIEGFLFLNRVDTFLTNNPESKEKYIKLLDKIKILDPACGSGRFLVATADYLLELKRIVYPNISTFNLKKKIIENNIFGVDIDDLAVIVTKLNLLNWLYLEKKGTSSLKARHLDLKNKDLIVKVLDRFSVGFNIVAMDFLMDYSNLIDHKFQLIIGNPPYIENKKLNKGNYKKKLYKNFYSAYKLFDISILFLEKSIEYLSNRKGVLSFIITNKFLAADFGKKIRKLLVEKTSIEEIINISSLPIFKSKSVYPIIISLTNKEKSKNSKILIRKYDKVKDIDIKNTNLFSTLTQINLNKLPDKVIPIQGNPTLIQKIYNSFETIEERYRNLQIVYRPFGFINYSKNLKYVSSNKKSKHDFVLLGTGNVGKYFIKFDKPITLAKKKVKVNYFNYDENLKDNWSKCGAEQIIFREIAKNLTAVYDPGNFTNLTGLYFLKVPNFSTDQLFALLVIINSDLMNLIFKTLFGTLHMASGYMRFNASFIRRLPIPNNLPSSLSQIGKALQFLSQIIYDYSLLIQKIPEFGYTRDELKYYFKILSQLANLEVIYLFLDKIDSNQEQKLDIYKDYLKSSKFIPIVKFKYPIKRFNLKHFLVAEEDEIIANVRKIEEFVESLNNDLNSKDILNQVLSYYNEY